MPDAPTLTKESEPTTAEQVAAVKPDAARDESDAAAWKEITGAEPHEDGIETPDFEKIEAEGKAADPEAPARGPDGKFTAKPDDADEPKAPADEKAQKKPEPKQEAKKDDKPLDRETRRKVVLAKEVVGRILKWDDAKIDAMDTAELIDLGQRLKPTFETVESLKSDLQKWKDRARGQKAADTDTPDDGPRRSRDPVDKADDAPAEPDQNGVDQLLRDFLDPTTLAQVKAAQRAERARFQDQVLAASERAEAAEAIVRNDRIEYGLSKVVEKFPQLKDDAARIKFLEAMDELDPSGERVNGDKAAFVKFMERVAWSEFGEDVERTTRQRLVTGNRRDVNGQPETTSHGSQPTAMSWDEFENYAAWASIEAGGNKAKLDTLMAKVKKPVRPK